MKLVSLKFVGGTPPIPGFRELGKGPYEKWTAHVRGPHILIVSPPGWQLGKADSGETRTAHELPRALCILQWEFAPGDDLGNTAKWSPEEDKPKK